MHSPRSSQFRIEVHQSEGGTRTAYVVHVRMCGGVNHCRKLLSRRRCLVVVVVALLRVPCVVRSVVPAHRCQPRPANHAPPSTNDTCVHGKPWKICVRTMEICEICEILICRQIRRRLSHSMRIDLMKRMHLITYPETYL